MRPGELRRFKDDAHFPRGAPERFTGLPFVVLNIFGHQPGRYSGRVEVLVGGKVLGPWGYPWVLHNSEPLEPVQPDHEVVY